MGSLKSRRARLVAGGLGALLLAGGGGALAATELSSPSAENSAIISNAAGQLGVTPSALSAALLKAIDDELSSEVSAGTINQSRATALESQLASGQMPLFNILGGGFGSGRGGFGLGVDLSAAESYLGLTSSQIRTDMQNGQTLAQIAVAQGKTADGLVSALVTAATSNLSSLVSSGKLSSTQEETIQSNLQTAISAIVNGTKPSGFPHGFRGGLRGHGRGGIFGGPGPTTTTTGTATA